MICIRQATLADKAAIFKFLTSAYKGREAFKFPFRWEWAFEQNPFIFKGKVPVQIAVNKQGDVIGQSAVLVEPLVVNGREFKVGWGVDFFVLPAYRRQGIGTQLQSANNRTCPIFMSLSMSEPTRKIKASLGMRYLPPVCEFIKNMRSRQVSHQIAPEIEIKEVAAFNEEINLIWERLGTNFAILVRRDAAYLNWKFVQQPHMEHQRFIAWQQGIPVGYVIIRHAQPPENNTGIICDLFADPKDEKLIRSLVAHAVDMFQMQQVDCVIVATGIPSFQALLENLGFKETRRIRPMIRADIEIPRTDSFFGKGDHDWDQYPLTNTKFNS